MRDESKTASTGWSDSRDGTSCAPIVRSLEEGRTGQRYLLAADDGNSTVRILRRKDGVEVSQFGHRGHDGGQFEALHQLAADNKGIVYTGEAGGGMRIQKFVPR